MKNKHKNRPWARFLACRETPVFLQAFFNDSLICAKPLHPKYTTLSSVER